MIGGHRVNGEKFNSYLGNKAQTATFEQK